MILTKQEMEILEYICKGLNNSKIAMELSITRATVKAHIYSIMRKLRNHTNSYDD